jgi:hypothetical protein
MSFVLHFSAVSSKSATEVRVAACSAQLIGELMSNSRLFVSCSQRRSQSDAYTSCGPQRQFYRGHLLCLCLCLYLPVKSRWLNVGSRRSLLLDRTRQTSASAAAPGLLFSSAIWRQRRPTYRRPSRLLMLPPSRAIVGASKRRRPRNLKRSSADLTGC